MKVSCACALFLLCSSFLSPLSLAAGVGGEEEGWNDPHHDGIPRSAANDDKEGAVADADDLGILLDHRLSPEIPVVLKFISEENDELEPVVDALRILEEYGFQDRIVLVTVETSVEQVDALLQYATHLEIIQYVPSIPSDLEIFGLSPTQAMVFGLTSYEEVLYMNHDAAHQLRNGGRGSLPSSCLMECPHSSYLCHLPSETPTSQDLSVMVVRPDRTLEDFFAAAMQMTMAVDPRIVPGLFHELPAECGAMKKQEQVEKEEDESARSRKKKKKDAPGASSSSSSDEDSKDSLSSSWTTRFRLRQSVDRA